MKAVLRILLVVCVFLLCGMNCMAQWVKSDQPNEEVYVLAANGTTVYAGIYDGVLRSDDNGSSWIEIMPTIFRSRPFYSLAVNDSILFAGTGGNGIFSSTDKGANWNRVNAGLTSYAVFSLVMIGSNIFAGTVTGGVFRSTENGKLWLESNIGLNDRWIRSIAVCGTRILAGTHDSGIYLSTDNGASWKAVNSGIQFSPIFALESSGTNLYAGTYGMGVFLSTNFGANWLEINSGLPDKNVTSISASNADIFIGTYEHGVYRSSNSGASWTEINYGIPGKAGIWSLVCNDKYLFAGIGGTGLNGVWRRPLSEITGIDDHHTEIPQSFALHQNFPNPFSSFTSISFTIPSRSFVSLKIFDALGKEVSTIVSGELSTGQHSYQWNAGGLRSGVYLCRLQAGSSVTTRKLSLFR